MSAAQTRPAMDRMEDAFPAPELYDEDERKFDLQYERIERPLLGEGTYGRVYKATNKKTGQHVAMKVMKLDSQEEGVPSTAIREIALLRGLSHVNVVQLSEVFCRPGKLILVFEFVENDLKKHMKTQDGRLSPAVVKHFLYQLMCGIEYCHSHRVIHRDLKPQNLLVDKELRLKLADFGLARAFAIPFPKCTHEVVTVWYRPPEILLGSPMYSLPVDIWSCGCIHGEMATGAPLFPGDSEIDTIFKIFQKRGTPTEENWPGLSKLPCFKPTFPKWPAKDWANIRNTAAQVGPMGMQMLDQCMAFDPKNRISARGALTHPYLADMGGTTSHVASMGGA